MIKGMQEVIDVMTKAKADLDKNGGLKQVIFVACGRLFRIFLSGTLFIKSGEFHPCSGLQQQRVRQCDPEERR